MLFFATAAAVVMLVLGIIQVIRNAGPEGSPFKKNISIALIATSLTWLAVMAVMSILGMRAPY